MRVRRWLVLFLALVLPGLLAAPAAAAPGDLDPSFSGDGIRLVPFGHGIASGEAVALQADGRIVVAGYVNVDYGYADVAVSRYWPDGQSDMSFGSGGRVILDFAVAMCRYLLQ
jgi:Domain of unknown function (DUF5122) beta-propeller